MSGIPIPSFLHASGSSRSMDGASASHNSDSYNSMTYSNQQDDVLGLTLKIPLRSKRNINEISKIDSNTINNNNNNNVGDNSSNIRATKLLKTSNGDVNAGKIEYDKNNELKYLTKNNINPSIEINTHENNNNSNSLNNRNYEYNKITTILPENRNSIKMILKKSSKSHENIKLNEKRISQKNSLLFFPINDFEDDDILPNKNSIESNMVMQVY